MPRVSVIVPAFDAAATVEETLQSVVAQTFDEEKGPHIVFADGTESIYLADLSGDGLTDIVRVRNGEVCYWPNLGYGRFGAKVTMDNAPWFDAPDQFDQRRIRLAEKALLRRPGAAQQLPDRRAEGLQVLGKPVTVFVRRPA